MNSSALLISIIHFYHKITLFLHQRLDFQSAEQMKNLNYIIPLLTALKYHGEIKKQCSALLSSSGSKDCSVEYNALLDKFLAVGGEKNDLIVRVGESMFDYIIPNGVNDRSHQGILHK